MNVTIFSLEIESVGSFQKIYSYFTTWEMCARIPLAMILVFVEYFHLAPLTFLLTFSGPFILLLSFLGLLWVITTALAIKGRFYIAFSFHFLLGRKVRIIRLMMVVSGRIQVNICQKHLCITCCVHKLFFLFVLTFTTINVHNMFRACSFHVLNS